MPPQSPPAPSPRPRFHLNPLLFTAALLLGALVSALHAWLLMKTSHPSDQAFGEALGMFVAMLLFPTFLAWIVFYIARRNQVAANTAFGVLLALATFGQFSEAARILLNKSHEGTAIQVANDVIGTLKSLRDDAQQKVQRFATAGGIDPATISTLDEIHQRETLLRDALAANQACRDFGEHAESHIREEFAKAGVPAALGDPVLADFHQSYAAKLPLALRLRDLDADYLQAQLDFLQLLEQQYPTWKYDPARHALKFQSQSAVDTYQAILTKLQTIPKQEQAVQKQLVQPATTPAQTSPQ